MSASSTKGRQDAAIYRQAAKIMEDGNMLANGSCCWALHVVLRPQGDPDLDTGPYGRRMKNVFAPRNDDAYWLQDNENFIDKNGHRILALCFMAAMVEAGDA